MEISPIPFVKLSYGRLSLDPGGLGLSVLETSNMQLGVSLGYGGGRDPKDLKTSHLDGFAKISDSAKLGFDFSYDFGPVEGYLEAEKFLSASKGASITFGVRTAHQVTRRLELFADLSTTASDDKYMQSYFGVSAADSLASGKARYDAKGGCGGSISKSEAITV